MQVNTDQTEGFTQTIQVLQTEYDGIKAQLDTLQTITAATNGYFSSVSASPTIVTDAAQLDAATPAELNELLQNGFPAADSGVFCLPGTLIFTLEMPSSRSAVARSQTA